MALTVGTSYVLTGTYTGTAPTGGQYAFDGVTTGYSDMSSFTINTGALTWQGTITLPAAGAHTIRVRKANLPNVLSALSGTFTVISTGGSGLLSAVSTWNGVEMNARDARQIVGVCADTKVGASYTRIAAQMNVVNMRRIRDHLAAGGQVISANYVAIRDAMVAANMIDPKPQVIGIVTGYRNEETTPAMSRQGALNLQAAGLLHAIEGPNEIDNQVTGEGSHSPTDPQPYAYSPQRSTPDLFADNQLAWAQWMRDLRVAEPSLASVKTLAPSLSQTDFSIYSAQRDMSAVVDGGTMHCYTPGGHSPDFEYGNNNDIGMFATVMKRVMAGQGMTGRNMNYITEGGGVTMAGHFDAPAHAKMILQTAYSMRALVGPKGGGLLYKLEDNNSDPNSLNDQNHYGQFYTPGFNGGPTVNPKPSALGLGKMQDCLSLNLNYKDAVNTTDTASFVPAFNTAGLVITGFPSGNGQVSSGQGYLVYHFSDGSTVIELAGYAATLANNGVSVTVPPITVTVNFGLSQTGIKVIDPLDTSVTAAATPVTSASASVITVQHTAHPKFVYLAPPSGYTQAGGDPRNVPATGSSTFGVKQSGITGTVVDSAQVVIAPPVAMTPGNKLLVWLFNNPGDNPQGPAGFTKIATYARKDSNGNVTNNNVCTTVWVGPIGAPTQQFRFTGMQTWSGAAWAEIKAGTITPYGGNATRGGNAGTDNVTLTVSGPAIPSGSVGLGTFEIANSPQPPNGQPLSTGAVSGGEVTVLATQTPTGANQSGLYRFGWLFSLPPRSAGNVVGKIPYMYDGDDGDAVGTVVVLSP